MWLTLAFISAALLGFYDTAKKASLKDNAVIPVLLLNTLFCSLIFLPLIILSSSSCILDDTPLKVAEGDWHAHKFIIIKSAIVLSSWLCGYIGMKRLPLTIVGPINATRPVMVLVGAMLVFGERLNLWQWAGVALAVSSFLLLSRSGKKEGIDFRKDHGIWFVVAGAVLGAVSGLYDKWLMAPDGAGLDRMLVQGWYNIYQFGIMGIMALVLWLPHRSPFKWRWSILLISIFISAADFAYFYALSLPDAMISIVSMVRRASVVVSFALAVVLFREKNIRSKALDLALVLLGMFCLWMGSR